MRGAPQGAGPPGDPGELQDHPGDLSPALYWHVPGIQRYRVWWAAIHPACGLRAGHDTWQGAERQRRELIADNRAAGGSGEWDVGDRWWAPLVRLRYERDGRTCCACGARCPLPTPQISGPAARPRLTDEELANWPRASLPAAEQRLAELRARRGRWTYPRIILEHLRFLRRDPQWVRGAALIMRDVPVSPTRIQRLGKSGDRRARELAEEGLIEARMQDDGQVEYRYPW